MRILLSFIISLFFIQGISAQSIVKDSVQKAKEDSLKMEKMKALLIYPILKAGDFSGVIPVKNVTEVPDPSINYKLLFELVINNKESEAKEINHGLTEICRILNLHAASGIPVKNITPIIVVHAKALFAFYTNEAYQKKYKTDNPNIAVIEELIKKTGVKFIACGQAMSFLEVLPEQMIPQMNVSLTAQTVLSHYQLKGYKLYEIVEDK
jgi:intracellular sulfur oxidation DsrE/DsrF family protein